MTCDDASHETPAATQDALFASLYSELRRLARGHVYRNGASDFVGTDTIVHETWIDLSRRAGVLKFKEPSRFLAYASRTMRGLVIDRVRAHRAKKRGGGLDITVLDTSTLDEAVQPEPMDELVNALEQLEQLDEELAQVIDLKYFCGLTLTEMADLLGASDRTVLRRLEKAKLLLHTALAA